MVTHSIADTVPLKTCYLTLINSLVSIFKLNINLIEVISLYIDLSNYESSICFIKLINIVLNAEAVIAVVHLLNAFDLFTRQVSAMIVLYTRQVLAMIVCLQNNCQLMSAVICLKDNCQPWLSLVVWAALVNMARKISMQKSLAHMPFFVYILTKRKYQFIYFCFLTRGFV